MIPSCPSTLPDAPFQNTLPRLPSIIRYYDDFSEETYSIIDPASRDVWVLNFDGKKASLDFSSFDVTVRLLIKHWVAFMICREAAPATVRIRFSALQRVTPEEVSNLLHSKPTNIAAYWQVFFAAHADGRYFFDAGRALLRFMAVMGINGWTPDYLSLVDQLPSPKIDKYAAVRAGDVFLNVTEEMALVRSVDNLTALVQQDPASVSTAQLEGAAILVCSYQFGLRPKQIAMLKVSDVCIRQDATGMKCSVHLTFLMIKQRSLDRRLPLPRRVKQDWTPLFIELLNRHRSTGTLGTARFFSVDSTREVGAIIMEETNRVLGRRRSANDLRHTAAQRLVDDGASQEELASFLGHSELETGLVYYRVSASQAERVNTALGISTTFQTVARIAHSRFISTDELMKLKGVQQIAGTPHGIPITGIGGCSSGQPACPYNPVMSCYGCPKFMPVRNRVIHEEVLADLRGIVKQFEQSARGDNNSPTYTQLRHVIVGVQSLIAEITGEVS